MRAVSSSLLIALIPILIVGAHLPLAAADAPTAPEAAQAAAGTPAPPQVAPAAATQATPLLTYAVRPSDTLRITTVGEQMYTGLFRANADGSVQFRDHMVGQVSLGGLTLEQAQSRLTERLARFLRSPAVTVELARFSILVAGAVRSPGQYEMDNGSLVMEAITRAGFGSTPAPEPAVAQASAAGESQPVMFVAAPGTSLKDLEHVYLRRLGGEVKTLDLRSYIEKGDVSQNIPLMAGDTVAVGYLGAPPDRAYRVSGAVKAPGKFWLQRQGEGRAQDALQAAGGPTEDADVQHCTVLHADGSQSELDLSQLDRNPALGSIAAGDELIVPRFPVTIQVLGAVNKPGRYRVPENATCLDAATLAGGFTADAILRDTCIVRGQPPTRVAANLELTLNGKDMKQNLVLKDGDVLFIPRRNPPGGGSSWSSVASTLSVLRWLIP